MNQVNFVVVIYSIWGSLSRSSQSIIRTMGIKISALLSGLS